MISIYKYITAFIANPLPNKFSFLPSNPVTSNKKNNLRVYKTAISQEIMTCRLFSGEALNWIQHKELKPP